MSEEGEYLGAFGPREIFASSSPFGRFRRPAMGELPPFARVPAAALTRGAQCLVEPEWSGTERSRMFLVAGCGAGIGLLVADKAISIDWNSEEAWG